MSSSQKAKILKHLEDGHSITPMEALNSFGCFRLSAVIFDLKQEGHDIKTKMVDNPNGKKFAQYSLLSKDGELNLGLKKTYQYPD